VNVIPFLELVGSSDSVVNILKNSQSGNALTAYAMFKIATPACYTVTLGGTSFTATCQGVSTGQDGRDQGAHHRENGRDKG
jgi:hypothetical protein